MIVVEKSQIEGSARDAAGPGWSSLRLLIKSDGMGFSMTETKVMPGAELTLQYKNHIEACFCISGQATVTETLTGTQHDIKPGTLYAPDQHDPHVLKVTSAEPLLLVCVFSPALEGSEVHGPDGSYSTT